jgi:hypothetical protein
MSLLSIYLAYITVLESTNKTHTDKYQGIINKWTYDASCMFTTFPVPDIENFKHLNFGPP